MTEQAYVPFKALNIPKGEVSLNQVTQIGQRKKKKKRNTYPITIAFHPHKSWTTSSALLELFLLESFGGGLWGNVATHYSRIQSFPPPSPPLKRAERKQKSFQR